MLLFTILSSLGVVHPRDVIEEHIQPKDTVIMRMTFF